MPGTNTLAYLASSSAMKEKSFITLTPGINILKLSSLPLMQRQNKLERLSFMKYFLPRMRFESETVANLSEAFGGKATAMESHSKNFKSDEFE